MDLVEFLRAQYDAEERDADELHSSDCESVRSLPFPCNCGYPARVLRDVESKRRLVDWIADLENKALDGDWWNLDYVLPLQLLAAPFADHQDYRAEWRP